MNTLQKSAFMIIDDQKSIAQLLKQKLELLTDVPIFLCHSLAEAKEVIADPSVQIDVCMCDMNLPDAPNGETIDFLLEQKITTMVLSGSFNEDTRKTVLAKGVADFVLKDSPAAIDYALKVLLSLHKNAQRCIWLVTSGQSDYAKSLVKFLKLHRYRTKIWSNLPKVIDIQKLERLPSMMIFEDSVHVGSQNVMKLISQLRQFYSPNQLPIIACEPDESIELAIQIMKNGANDFFNTSINPEGLSARLRQDIELSESYQEVEYISQRDPLTGLFNRRHFFELANEGFAQSKQSNSGCFALMFDIDHFKNINDTYGHQKGDEVIIYTAHILSSYFEGVTVGRFGGEEFCVFGTFSGNFDSIEKVETRANMIRKNIETQADIDTGVYFTISSGICHHAADIEQMISHADKALYQSKESGRNRVTVYQS